ncbi:nucleoporin NUP188-like isoform X1 [Cloeon dipterum]|uniref:nucleoporin NUP188-like isoform X1 n=1 Tax=Cloeon dipterum TaxID=197152 RepID=UPI00321F7C2C
MESYSNCKELWADLSATGVTLSEDNVNQILQTRKDQLLNGILCFKKSKSETAKRPNASTTESKNVKTLINLISDTISVDSEVARRMLEQYLMYQFRGEGRTIERYLSDTVLKMGLLADIWTSVLRESIFLLHSVKLILSPPAEHPYKALFDSFAEGLDADVVMEKLLAQLECLLEESPPTIKTLEDEWIASMLSRRMILCQSFMLLKKIAPVKTVVKLINLFKEKKFSQQLTSEGHKSLASLVSFSQTCLLIHLILQLPKLENTDLVKEKSAIAQLREIVCSLESKNGGLLKLAYNASFYTGPEDDAMALVVSAFEEDQFEYIHAILTAINDTGDSVMIAKVSLMFFELLDVMVDRYYVTGFSNFPMFFSTCALILSQPNTGAILWGQDECSLRALFRLSLDYFPHLSQRILHLLIASAKADKLNEMLKIIADVDMYTEEKSVNSISVLLGQDNDVSLVDDMSVMDSLLTIPAGTQGVISHQNSPHPLVHWSIRYNFWDALYNQLIKINAELRRNQSFNLEKALLILKCIHSVLEAGILDDYNMTNTIHESFLLIEIACQMSVPPAELLAQGLEILRALMHAHKSRVCEMAAQTRLVPCWLGPGPPSLLGQVEYGVWQHLLLGLHITPAMSSLLKAYLRFLIVLAESDSSDASCESVLAAGFLVVTQNIFPGHTEWLYPRLRDEETIGVLCLQFTQALINKGENWEKLVVECLLKTKASMTLMQLAASGEDHIENILVRESSFYSTRSRRLLLKIRLSLSLLNQALLKRHIVLGECSRDCILLQQLSSSHQVESDNFYFRLSLYLQSRLHPYLPTLAVKVLQQVFEVLPVSLRFYLRMDDTLIRNTLEMHLLAHDSFPPLRAALLDLLTNCVRTSTQSALLVLMFTERSKEKEVQALPPEGAKSDTLDFILSTLQEAKEDPTTVHSEVYKAAVDFCEACWVAPVLYVLKSIVSSKNFWEVFTTPLLKYEISNEEQFLQLLRVLYIEIVRPKFPPEELDKALKNFAQNRLLQWNTFVMEKLKDIGDESDAKIDSLCRVWSNLIVALLKKRKTLLDDHCICELTEAHLDLLIHSLSEVGDIPHAVISTQVLLHLVTSSSSFKDLGDSFTEKVVKLAELVGRRYSYMKPATRTTLLSILVKSLTCEAFSAQQANRSGFDSHVCDIVSKESMEGRRLGLHKGGETMAYVLVLRLLQVSGDKLFNFGSEMMFSCLVKDAVSLIRERKSALCPEIILKTLVLAASTPSLSAKIGPANLKLMWMALLDLKVDMAGNKDAAEWDVVYEQGVYLASAMVDTNQQSCRAEVATFLVDHRAHLISRLVSMRSSQDRKTLMIISQIVHLLASLSAQLCRHQHALQTYVMGVLACLNLVLTFMVRPKAPLESGSKASMQPAQPWKSVNEKSNLLMSVAEGCVQFLLTVCQPSGQLSRRTLFADWRQCRLVLIDDGMDHFTQNTVTGHSFTFSNMFNLATNCLLFVDQLRTYSRSQWYNEPDLALADEAVTLRVMKICIDLLLQQARVKILQQPDCITFRTNFKHDMENVIEMIKMKIFNKNEVRNVRRDKTLSNRALLNLSADSSRLVAR